MNDILNILIANNKFLVAIETRLINIESKLDKISSIGTDDERPMVSIPKEYPQSAGEEDVAE